MLDIALVCPWPPQKSGIADYSIELAQVFKNAGFYVHVFTTEANPERLDGVHIFHVTDLEDAITLLNKFEYILIQLGNHPDFHGWMLPIIETHAKKCTVELHDVMLHHLMHGVLGDWNEAHYLRWIRSQYGNFVSDYFEQEINSGIDILKRNLAAEYCCSDAILFGCNNIIVHSEFAAAHIRHRHKKVYVVPLAYILNKKDKLTSEVLRQTNTSLRIGVFGTVQTNRRVECLLAALARIKKQGLPFCLQICGQLDKETLYLKNHSYELGIFDNIEYFGYLNKQSFDEHLRECDIHVALRNPTMGETSGVVTKGLQYGIPTIVSNVGWYSELPDCVLKVPNNYEVDSLEDFISILHKNISFRNKISIDTLEYARNNLSITRTADDIISICIGN
jgi:glycosyltransferase involved in cell wall biosynthesis